jgi:hypothetical protein
MIHDSKTSFLVPSVTKFNEMVSRLYVCLFARRKFISGFQNSCLGILLPGGKWLTNVGAFLMVVLVLAELCD